MDASCSSKYWDCDGSELQAEEDPNLRELSQQTYHGSAPEYLSSELSEPEEDPAVRLVQETDKYEDERLRDLLELTSIDPSQLEIVESIGEGGQAHVFLAKYTRRPGGMKEDVVVKRYKGRVGVRAVHELRRRIRLVETARRAFYLCRLIGLLEDNISGEVSVVMEAYRGDLRNFIDKRMDYLKSRMRSNMQDDDATQMMMMPFPYNSTLRIMEQIALGMENLRVIGIIHRSLKASDIFVVPGEYEKDGRVRYHNSRKVELKEDLAYDWFFVCVGDYEGSNGVVGTGFWRPPEVLKAVKEDIRPTYTTAVDVYGFGMVCYELLTGHIPFQCEGVRRSDYDAVLSGRRPQLPDYLSPGMTQLLLKCWHHDPCQRPRWDEIQRTLHTERRILLGEDVDGTKLE
jgi:serine/threonine protein kinase